MELRVSMDEREDPDEEQEIQVDGLPFVVSEEVIDSYGLEYSIFVNDTGVPGVSAGSQKAAGSADQKEACPL